MVSLRVRDVGPLVDVSVEFGDLTVFAGPPNVGKSYVLKAFYAGTMLYDPCVLERLVGRLFSEARWWARSARGPAAKSWRASVEDVDRELRRLASEFLPVGERSAIEISGIQRPVPTATPPRSAVVAAPGGAAKATVELRLDEGGLGLEAAVEGGPGSDLETALELALSRASLDLAFRLGGPRSVFIPFGRTPLVHLALMEEMSCRSGVLCCSYCRYGVLYCSYIRNVLAGIERLKEGGAPHLGAVLLGDLYYDAVTHLLRYRRGSVDVPLSHASALASEVAGVLLPLLATPVGSTALIEEPEAQLHPSAQVLMAVALYAVAAERPIALTTHSDILAVTLAYLATEKYDEDRLKKLVEEMLKLVGGAHVDPTPLAKAAVAAKRRGLDVRFYHMPKEGEVKAVSAADVRREVPSLTAVPEALAAWAWTT